MQTGSERKKELKDCEPQNKVDVNQHQGPYSSAILEKVLIHVQFYINLELFENDSIFDLLKVPIAAN